MTQIRTSLTWQEVIGPEKSKPYFKKIRQFLDAEKARGITIYPSNQNIFAAFSHTPFADIKVVILGQDPYHGPGQAHGLSFSVPRGIAIPPSLQNIYKALAQDVDFQIPSHGDLTPWAEQGVLLLNTVLTVEAHKAHAHRDIGWETFTDMVISAISQYNQDVVFLLWGSHAKHKQPLIDEQKHIVLSAPHPSPLSAHRGFFDCQHFSTTNQVLVERGYTAIDWQLPQA
jgi:uracil-DNA glycosylase